MRLRTETKVGIFVIVGVAALFYMTFRLGVFRMSLADYNPYYLRFENVSGLSKKGDVKIAGVKVGWIDSIDLKPGEQQAQVKVMLKDNFVLHDDAYGVIRQEGLLGSRYLEVVPGNPDALQLSSGATLGRSGQSTVSAEDLMRKFSTIADDIQQVSGALKNVTGSVDGSSGVSTLIKNISEASENISKVAASLQRTVSDNESHLNTMIKDISSAASEAKESIPQMRNDFNRLTQRLDTEILPAVKEGFEKVSGVFDRDLSGVASQIKTVTDSVERMTIDAQASIQNITSVTQKLDSGEGFLGKLINDTDTFEDLRYAARGIKNYFAAIESMGIVVDGHTESMLRPIDGYRYREAKSYLNFKFYTNEDTFVLLGLVGSEKGFPKRTVERSEYQDENGRPLNVDSGTFFNGSAPVSSEQHSIKVNRNSLALNAQVGKAFKDIAFRVGLFDGMGGIGVDFNMPGQTENFRWLMTFEAYDFNGQNHFLERDRRPHLKWINDVFIFRNFYLTFGADDFVSRHSASAFFGAGMRFSDEDLKFLISRIGTFGSFVGG